MHKIVCFCVWVGVCKCEHVLFHCCKYICSFLIDYRWRHEDDLSSARFSIDHGVDTDVKDVIDRSPNESTRRFVLQLMRRLEMKDALGSAGPGRSPNLMTST